jgi:hypothetical protein
LLVRLVVHRHADVSLSTGVLLGAASRNDGNTPRKAEGNGVKETKGKKDGWKQLAMNNFFDNNAFQTKMGFSIL